MYFNPYILVMRQEYTWDLIALNLSGEASEEEVMELDQLQNDFPEIDYYIQIFSALWQSRPINPEVIDGSFDKLLQRIQKGNF